jgi:hypothetical protein
LAGIQALDGRSDSAKLTQKYTRSSGITTLNNYRVATDLIPVTFGIRWVFDGLIPWIDFVNAVSCEPQLSVCFTSSGGRHFWMFFCISRLQFLDAASD